MNNKVLKLVGKRGKTVTQVAEKLNISNSYASRILRNLEADGKVTTKGFDTKTGGRPAAVYAQAA